MPASDLTLTPEQIEEGRRLNREADPGQEPFGLQRGVPPYGTPDECYVTDASGLCLWNERGALDRPADGRLIAWLLTHRDALLAMAAGYVELMDFLLDCAPHGANAYPVGLEGARMAYEAIQKARIAESARVRELEAELALYRVGTGRREQ